MMKNFSTTSELPVRAVTKGPQHHFFGYYDKHQWDDSGRYLLGMRVAFTDRQVQADDVLDIGVIDLADGDRWRAIDQTRAWCWQQGCMLQWVPGVPGGSGGAGEIIYNDRIGDRFVATMIDVQTNKRRTLPRPVYTLAGDGSRALSLNFSRNAVTRPGYGYVGLKDQWADDPHPADDGIWAMDLYTGNHELIVSIDQAFRFASDTRMQGKFHWVNHLLFNPDATRFIFLHRWAGETGGFDTGMFTANADGTGLHRCPVGDASHFIWFDARRILVWDGVGAEGPGYYLVEDQTDHTELIAPGVLTVDGHMTVSPNGKWILTDEYPDAQGMRPLILYRIADAQRIELGRFHSPMPDSTELRCDLHPRWNRSGTQVSFDSVHEGSRQIYVADVSQVVGSD